MADFSLLLEKAPSGWNNFRLGDICTRVQGNYQPDPNGTRLYLGLEHLVQGLPMLVGRGNESNVKSSKNAFRPNDVLFGKLRPYLRKCVLMQEEGVCSTDILVFRANANVLPQYLCYLCHTDQFIGNAKATTSGVQHPRTSWNSLSEFRLTLPPTVEQRRIAHVLTRVQTAIEQQARLIALTRELKSALMRKLFTEGLPVLGRGRGEKQKGTEIGLVPESWEVVELASLLEETEQVNLRTEGKRQIKYIDVSSISREYLRVETTTEYLLKDAPGRARKKVKTGDVIFATVRPTLLRVAYIGEELNDQVCSTAFCVLRAKKDVSDKYIHYVVQREQFIKQLAAIESGASYPAVTDRQVKNQKVPKPKFDEQSQIAEMLDTCDKKAFQHAMKKEKLEELFRTLLHQLMTGQTRVNEINLDSLTGE